MGFGTLFIGYFLLLNLTYYGITDIIASLIMLLGLYKLSPVNRPFKLSAIVCAVFSVFSLFELVIHGLSMLSIIGNLSALLPYLNMVRLVIVTLVSVSALVGMRDVAIEVGLSALASKCAHLAPVTAAVYALWVLLEAPFVIYFPPSIIGALSLFAILSLLAVIIINLTAIYGCYMKICMPDEKDMPIKESKIGFVREYEKRQQEKSAEYAKYRLERAKKKYEKKGKGKK